MKKLNVLLLGLLAAIILLVVSCAPQTRTEGLSDGRYLSVTGITYQDYAGGIHQATFCIR